MANKWTSEQELAILKQNSNILVSASAGSGKTAVLVERVINKVIKYSTDIDKILVVTFTNASAAELKERLLLAIYKALDENPDNNFLKRQLKYINRASITTIHAFCLELIRANFHILNLDPNFKICEESKSLILKTEAINRLLEEKYLETIENEKNNIKEEFGLYNILELFSSKDDKFIEDMLKIYSYIQSFDYPFLYLEKECEKYNIEDDNIDLIDTDFGKEIFDEVKLKIKVLLKKTEDIRNSLDYNEEFVKFAQVFDNDITFLKLCFNSENFDRIYNNLNYIIHKICQYIKVIM